MTAALVTVLALFCCAAVAATVAGWSTRHWDLPADNTQPDVDPLDPDGNQAAVSAAVSVACRRVAP